MAIDTAEVEVSSTTAKVYTPPGRPGSVVEVKHRYDNFIGGRWVPPVKGQYSKNLGRRRPA